MTLASDPVFRRSGPKSWRSGQMTLVSDPVFRRSGPKS